METYSISLIRTEGLGNGHVSEDCHNGHHHDSAAQLMKDIREYIGAVLVLESKRRQLNCGHGRGDLGGKGKRHRLNGALLHPDEHDEAGEEDHQSIARYADVPKDLLQTTSDCRVLFEIHLREELKMCLIK